MKEERRPRAYKIANRPYLRAKKKARGKLATLIEEWVTEYGKKDTSIIFTKQILVSDINDFAPKSKTKHQ